MNDNSTVKARINFNCGIETLEKQKNPCIVIMFECRHMVISYRESRPLGRKSLFHISERGNMSERDQIARLRNVRSREEGR